MLLDDSDSDCKMQQDNKPLPVQASSAAPSGGVPSAGDVMDDVDVAAQSDDDAKQGRDGLQGPQVAT